jgi:hypothetical protein
MTKQHSCLLVGLLSLPVSGAALADTRPFCDLYTDNICNVMVRSNRLGVALNRPNQEMCEFKVIADVGYRPEQAHQLVSDLQFDFSGESLTLEPVFVNVGNPVLHLRIHGGEHLYAALFEVTARDGGTLADVMTRAFGPQVTTVVFQGVPCTNTP